MNPYFYRDGITIYLDKCETILPSIDPASVSLLIADPPYGVEAAEASGQRRRRNPATATHPCVAQWTRRRANVAIQRLPRTRTGGKIDQDSGTAENVAVKFARSISEAEWQRVVIEIALLNSWRLHCVPDALYRRSFAVSHHGANQGHKGWPDLAICKPPRLIIAELKAEAGRVRPEQQEWLDDLDACGVEVYVWKPRDMDDVIEILSREAA